MPPSNNHIHQSYPHNLRVYSPLCKIRKSHVSASIIPPLGKDLSMQQ